jgi:hypothetical protein
MKKSLGPSNATNGNDAARRASLAIRRRLPTRTKLLTSPLPSSLSPTASHPVTDTVLLLLEVTLSPTPRFSIANIVPGQGTTRETAGTRIPP